MGFFQNVITPEIKSNSVYEKILSDWLEWWKNKGEDMAKASSGVKSVFAIWFPGVYDMGGNKLLTLSRFELTEPKCVIINNIYFTKQQIDESKCLFFGSYKELLNKYHIDLFDIVFNNEYELKCIEGGNIFRYELKSDYIQDKQYCASSYFKELWEHSSKI